MVQITKVFGSWVVLVSWEPLIMRLLLKMSIIDKDFSNLDSVQGRAFPELVADNPKGEAIVQSDAQINEPGPIITCPGETVILTANESGNYQYQWQILILHQLHLL